MIDGRVRNKKQVPETINRCLQDSILAGSGFFYAVGEFGLLHVFSRLQPFAQSLFLRERYNLENAVRFSAKSRRVPNEISAHSD